LIPVAPDHAHREDISQPRDTTRPTDAILESIFDGEFAVDLE
jgi:hypothetical protein